MVSIHLALSLPIVTKSLFLNIFPKLSVLSEEVKSSQFRSIVYPAVCPACLFSKGSASTSLSSSTIASQTRAEGKEKGVCWGSSHRACQYAEQCWASNAAERWNLLWQFPYPKRYLAYSGHPVWEELMIFQLVSQASPSCERKAAFSFMKDFF